MDAVSRCTHVSDRYRLYFKPNDELCLVAVSQADIDLCGRYLWIPLCRHWLMATHNNYGEASDHKVDDSCSVGFSVCAPLSKYTLKRKCLHFDEIFVTGCTGSCQNDNFQCSQWLKFRQNDDIFVSVIADHQWHDLHRRSTLISAWWRKYTYLSRITLYMFRPTLCQSIPAPKYCLMRYHKEQFQLKHPSKLIYFKSLDPGGSGCDFKNESFNLILLINIFISSYDNALSW